MMSFGNNYLLEHDPPYNWLDRPFKGTVSRDLGGYQYCYTSIESSFQGVLSPIIKF